jgi:hypothetical protein
MVGCVRVGPIRRRHQFLCTQCRRLYSLPVVKANSDGCIRGASGWSLQNHLIFVMLTAKIGEGPRKNFPPQHKENIGVQTPSGYPDKGGLRLVRIHTPSSGVQSGFSPASQGPRQHLSSEIWPRAGLLTRTHSGIQPSYDRASYDPAAPRHGVPLSIPLHKNPAAPRHGVPLSIPL